MVRATDTVDDLARKVRIASILGTIQSTFTNFPYLGAEWERNTKGRASARCVPDRYYGQ
jgi:hypothetical protein